MSKNLPRPLGTLLWFLLTVAVILRYSLPFREHEVDAQNIMSELRALSRSHLIRTPHALTEMSEPWTFYRCSTLKPSLPITHRMTEQVGLPSKHNLDRLMLNFDYRSYVMVYIVPERLKFIINAGAWGATYLPPFPVVISAFSLAKICIFALVFLIFPG